MVKKSKERIFDRKLIDLEEQLMTITKCPPEKIDEFKNTLNSFKVVYKRNWQACRRIDCRFLKKNQEWLNEEISFPTALVSGSSKGRPSKEFSELSDRSKRRQTMELRLNVLLDKLTYATQMSQRAAGNNDTAKILITNSPTMAAKFRRSASVNSQTNTTHKHTPQEALAILVEANLTMSQYEVIHQANRDIYPCYKYVQKAKQDCYPQNIVGESFAEVKLQDLVNHTTLRLWKYLEPVIEVYGNKYKNFVLIFKWGCDGSQQKQYKQKFEDNSDSDGVSHFSNFSKGPIHTQQQQFQSTPMSGVSRFSNFTARTIQNSPQNQTYFRSSGPKNFKAEELNNFKNNPTGDNDHFEDNAYSLNDNELDTEYTCDTQQYEENDTDELQFYDNENNVEYENFILGAHTPHKT
ncbi:unnamed protein product [Brassicogethes aeneus]|uniref:Uncharacterized protein n=1 Tax=Brassicogethes aeneus TaxID=1431903 RepID=A0A9P0FDZ2_BRAAE|nr:unnamed protein product [Brassicogethes aeneus]